VGYPADSGTDDVVAFADDVPKGKQGFQVPVHNALLRVTKGEGRVTISADEIERQLRKSRVWERAQTPRTSRQKLSAALPAAIALLGLLSLAFGLPGLILPRSIVLSSLLRVLLIGGVAVGAGWVMLEGALGWPGSRLLEDLSERFELKMGKPVALKSSKLKPAQTKALEALLSSSAKARAKKRFKVALKSANDAAKIAPDHAQVQRALGYAHQGNKNHSKAVEHLGRYLKLDPKAPDKAKVEAYLKKMKGR
jgi:tetratricopeptide (TPR) repeat protein